MAAARGVAPGGGPSRNQRRGPAALSRARVQILTYHNPARPESNAFRLSDYGCQRCTFGQRCTSYQTFIFSGDPAELTYTKARMQE